jgi:adenylate cyclase
MGDVVAAHDGGDIVAAFDEPYIEAERKFLIESLPPEISSESPALIRQGYLVSNDEVELRVRLQEYADGSAAPPTLTVKSGASERDRSEDEFTLRHAFLAERLFASAAYVVEKQRFGVLTPVPGFPAGHHYAWEIDVFLGRNAGLILAELELGDLPLPSIFPDWVGDEVTGDARYYNRVLARRPYREWGQASE